MTIVALGWSASTRSLQGKDVRCSATKAEEQPAKHKMPYLRSLDEQQQREANNGVSKHGNLIHQPCQDPSEPPTHRTNADPVRQCSPHRTSYQGKKLIDETQCPHNITNAILDTYIISRRGILG